MQTVIAHLVPKRVGVPNARNVNGRLMSFQSLDELRRVLVELELGTPTRLGTK